MATVGNQNKLGRLQMKILEHMRRYGDGIWHSQWYTTDQVRKCLDSLVARGLITPVDQWRDGKTHQAYKLVPPK